MDRDQIIRGIERLYRYRRGLSLNAPLPILARFKEQLVASKKELGDDWSIVELNYPKYAKQRLDEDEGNQKWDQKCLGCAHWKGYPWEWQDEDLDIQELQWCERFRIDEISRQAPCSGFSEKGKEFDHK